MKPLTESRDQASAGNTMLSWGMAGMAMLVALFAAMRFPMRVDEYVHVMSELGIRLPSATELMISLGTIGGTLFLLAPALAADACIALSPPGKPFRVIAATIALILVMAFIGLYAFAWYGPINEILQHLDPADPEQQETIRQLKQL